MPNDSIVARCPYYRKGNQITIYCESNVCLQDHSDPDCSEEQEEGSGKCTPQRHYAHIFKNATEKMKYMREHCGKYPDMNCPYADYMSSKYEGENGNETENKTKKSKQTDRNSGKSNRRAEKGKSVSVRLM